MKFKKITAIVSSVLLAGLSIGAASAASYPAPFVEDGVADVAIVYGTGAGVSSLDQVQAGNIQTSLASYVESDMVVSGGEEFELYRDAEKFHIGDGLNEVYPTLDDNEMEDFLAEGEYDDMDTDYSQSINMGTVALTLFADRDYQDEEPTLGFYFDDDKVLDYTLTFDDGPITYANLESTDLPLFNREYYVLDSSDESKLTLLDTAEKNVLSEGESITIGNKQVSISYISDNSVKFNVDGELTDLLDDTGTNYEKYYELDDGSYIIANEILYASKETGVSKVEFSIGSGEIILKQDGTVELNDEEIDGLTSSYTVTAGEINSITINWATDDEEFLVEGGTLSMPIFEALNIAFTGIDFPSTSETISIENGEAVTLVMENFEIEMMFTEDGSTVTQGGDRELLVIDGTPAASKDYYLAKDEKFLATYVDRDVEQVKQMYHEVDSMDNTNDGLDLTLRDLTGNDDDIVFEDDEAGDTDRTIRDIIVTLNDVYEEGLVYNSTYSGIPVRYWNLTQGVSNSSLDDGDILLDDVSYFTVEHDDGLDLHFDKVVSETGMVVEIPAAANLSSNEPLVSFYEADEDGDLDTLLTTPSFQSKLAWNNDDSYIYGTKYGSLSFKEEADNQDIAYVNSALASRVMVDSDADTFDVDYFGDEVSADVKVVAGGEVSMSTTGSLGEIIVRDSEVDSVDDKNLIIIGGSCINSAAATVLGGSYCGPSFTQATGISTGEFLIKGFEDAFTNGKMALVVAGYEAADTANAATYLTMRDVETDEAYRGTSATEATMITESM